MLAKTTQIRAVVITCNKDDKIDRVIHAIAGAGGECTVVELARMHNISASTDVVIFDARENSLPQSLLSSTLPVIALIDASQSAASLSNLAYVDDMISIDTASNALVLLRIKRQLDRFRNPVASMRYNSPEFNVLKTVVNTTRDQVYVKDLDHRFLFVSDVFAETNGRSMDDVLGKDDLEIGSNPIDVLGSAELGWLGFWAKDNLAVEEGRRTCEENPEWSTKLEDSKQKRVSRVPLKNNRNEVYALVVVSSNKFPLDANVADVKTRGIVLERALNAMKVAQESQILAERAVTEKNKLLAAASHDLRQPLHAMGLFLDVLERRLDGEQERDLIAKIKRSSDALSALFNSLLDITRLDAGVVRVNREHFPLDTMLNALRSEFREIGSQKQLNVEILPCKNILYTDPMLFERILRNLIQNAITYTNTGSVSVKCESEENNLILSVIDTGPGIPHEEQSAIFSEYYQIEYRDEAPTKGLGLGLAIVKRLAELLNLTIDLKSEVGSGSTFSVKIPLGEYAKAGPKGSTVEPCDLDGQIIVIIDDESDILEGMASMLINYNCEFITAESSNEALQVLIDRDIVPDVVVADYRLKYGCTGDQAIAAIREEFSLDIPGVIVTGDISADRLKDATSAGCQLLHKPVRPDVLVSAISEALSGVQDTAPVE